MALSSGIKKAATEAIEKQRSKDPFVVLGNLAREKYQKFKETGIPLENAHIADVQREGSQFKEDRAAALGRNSAIQAMGPVAPVAGVGPNQMVRALDNRRKVVGDSAAQGAIAGANAQLVQLIDMAIAPSPRASSSPTRESIT